MSDPWPLLAAMVGLVAVGGGMAVALGLRRRRAASQDAAAALGGSPEEDPILAAMGIGDARSGERRRES